MGNGKLKNVKSRAVFNSPIQLLFKTTQRSMAYKVELLFSFFFKRLPFESWMIRKKYFMVLKAVVQTHRWLQGSDSPIPYKYEYTHK